jgi:hypothetical protein
MLAGTKDSCVLGTDILWKEDYIIVTAVYESAKPGIFSSHKW